MEQNTHDPQSSRHWHTLKEQLRRQAHTLGLGTLAVTHAEPAATLSHYEAWVAQGYHGEMGYLARPDRLERRRDLNVILEGVQSVILVAVPYWPGSFPKEQNDPMHGVISCYAWGTDYHKIIEKKLKQLSKWLMEFGGGKARLYVDHGAVQERDLATRAGLGFTGKHTLLIHPRYGSGMFLGEILSTLPLPPDEAPNMPDCGSCTRCLDACPTDAFVGPYTLDARKCISYLTIELKGSIPLELRKGIGNRIYGCDICQQVCPWTHFAGGGDSPLWGSPSQEVTTPKLLDLIELDEDAFLKRFESSPIRRVKRSRLVRNVCIALGNAQDPQAIPALRKASEDEDPVIREHAEWGLQQIQEYISSQNQ